MSRIYSRDANHDEIKQALIDAHLSVYDTARVGGDFPDLVVGGYHQDYEIPYNALIEIKTLDGKLRPGQQIFQSTWRGQIAVVQTIEQALAIFGIK
jgi:hypothetical protein